MFHILIAQVTLPDAKYLRSPEFSEAQKTHGDGIGNEVLAALLTITGYQHHH